MKLDRPGVQKLRGDLTNGLAVYATEQGIEIKVGSIRYEMDGSAARVTLECSVINSDGTVQTRDRTDFANYASMFQLKPSDIDREFTIAGERYKITGLSMKAKKYPIKGVRVSDGKRFKFGTTQVRMALEREG